MRRTRLLALTLSVLLHVTVVAPRWAAWEQSHAEDEAEASAELDLSEPDDEEGELPIEPLWDAPFHVELYVEPAPPPPPSAAQAAVEPAEDAVVALPLPAPVPLPPAEEAVAAVEPEPVPVPEPPPVEEPLPEPPLSEEDRKALASMERGEATAETPTEDDDGEADELSDREKRLQARAMRRERARDRKDRHARRPPCPESSQSIARVAEAAWYIDRDLIEYYATHMVELQKLGSVWTHRNTEGDLDGFRVALARCSVLRQGGLRSGDVVHDINGRRINSVLQAIGAYIALRAEPELVVNISRKGQPVALAYTIEQPERKRDKRRAARKAAASQAAR